MAAKEDNLFVPAKMMDYFAAGRPILAFVPQESETCMILNEANMDEYVSDEQDVEQGSRNLEKLWGKWRKRELPSSRSPCVGKWAWSNKRVEIIRMISGNSR